MNQPEIDNLAENALNAACLVIQDALGVTSGDLAGHFFSDGEVKDKLMDYIRSELSQGSLEHE